MAAASEIEEAFDDADADMTPEGIATAQTDTLPVAPIAVATTRNAWHSDGNVSETDESGPNEQSEHAYDSSHILDVTSTEVFPTANDPDSSPTGIKRGFPQVGPSAMTVNSSPRVVCDGEIDGIPRTPTS